MLCSLPRHEELHPGIVTEHSGIQIRRNSVSWMVDCFVTYVHACAKCKRVTPGNQRCSDWLNKVFQ